MLRIFVIAAALTLATGASADSWRCSVRDANGVCIKANPVTVKQANAIAQRCFTDDKAACDQWHAICKHPAPGTALYHWCKTPVVE